MAKLSALNGSPNVTNSLVLCSLVTVHDRYCPLELALKNPWGLILG